jgi:hypothetical protein
MMIATIPSMRRLLAGFLLLLAGLAPAGAQNDIAVVAMAQPVSGCALTATENVTLRIFNYGVTLPAATQFFVAYTINAGPQTVETVTLGSSLLSNSTLTYTFVTQANLTVPGSYTLDATVSLAGDVTPTNNAFNGTIVVNSAPSAGGAVNGPAPGPSGTLTLSGHTGAIVQWEESPDAQRWFKLANTTTTQDYANVTAPTRFRARVASGSCPTAVSTTFVVNP